MSETPPSSAEPPAPEGERTASASSSALPDKSPGELSLLLQRLAAAHDAGPEEFEAGLKPGTAVGRFEVLREIGRGGFGAVYEALDRELGRRVALKLLRPRKKGRTRDAEALAAEARALAGLEHPAVVALFDVGSSPAGPFLVEELLRGETLGERLGRGPLPPTEALRVAIAVARVLAQAHRQGVVHRDLKPDNVFLCEDGRVKLLDFGLAHLLGAKASLGAGTPAYMAPEQALGQEVDGRADVFAAAAVLHECLAGARPFAAGEDGYPRFDVPPKPLPAAVPKPLVQVVRAGLALSPEARPGIGRAWLDALRRAESALDRPARLRRFGALVTGGAILGATIAGVLLLRSRPHLVDLPDEARKTVAVLPFTPLSEDKEAEHLADGVQVEMIATLSQRPDLVVIGRSSVEAWRKQPRDLKAISAALGVGSLLEGSVQRVGNRIRIVVSLLDPRNGRSLWAEKYDRELGDVLAVQTEVSGHVARMLGARVGERDGQRARGRPANPEAYALYLEALGLWTRSFGVAEDNRLALQLVERSVALDPDLAGARALLSQAKAAAASDWDLGNRARNLLQAREHAERALALDPRLPAARVAMVTLLVEEGRQEEASRAIEEAYAVAPADSDVANYVAFDRAYGRGLWRDALAIREEQLRRNPRDLVAFNQLLMAAMRTGRLERAEVLCQGLAAWMPPPRPVADYWCALVPAWRSGDLGPLRALASNPTEDMLFYYGAVFVALAPAEYLSRLADPKLAARFWPQQAALVRGLAERRLRHAAAARRAFEEALTLARSAESATAGVELRTSMLTKARALAALGRGDEAMAAVPGLLAQIPERERHEWLPFVSLVAIDAGRTAEAIDALDESLSRLPLWTTAAMLRVDPRFEALHGDPRFEAMLAKHARLPGLPDP